MKCFRFRPGWFFACAWLVATSIGAQPVNDNFANPESLSGASGQVVGNNTGATIEAGEPFCSQGVNSVWYRWTAPSNGRVTFDTMGSFIDTTLAAYTGPSVPNLICLACNDDYYGGGFFRLNSLVNFPAQAGSVYYISVGAWNGSGGLFVLNWHQSPSTGSQIQFASRVYSTNGNFPGTAVISVTCPSGASNVFTVDYQAASGTAVDGVDFTSRSGTLTFDIADTQKTFTVPILGHGNNNSWIDLSLSNPTGGVTLGDSQQRSSGAPRPGLCSFRRAIQLCPVQLHCRLG